MGLRQTVNKSAHTASSVMLLLFTQMLFFQWKVLAGPTQAYDWLMSVITTCDPDLIHHTEQIESHVASHDRRSPGQNSHSANLVCKRSRLFPEVSIPSPPPPPLKMSCSIYKSVPLTTNQLHLSVCFSLCGLGFNLFVSLSF